MKIFNTLGRQLEQFQPLTKNKVRLYTCGPTVYDYQHIGNYSGYIYWDVLVRLLRSLGYDVTRVMNITDVGHLVSDEDEGEDKLEKGAKREGKTARQVADFYAADFLQSMDRLNLIKPDTYAKATDYIQAQIDIVQQLMDKGFAYRTEQAIYFNVAKLDDYGKLTGQKLSEKEVGARSDVVTDDSKRNPQDFALWFFAVGRFANHEMRWDSPWGSGFPGWHVECSAIIHAVLGDPIDMHTGGIDHIGTHHTNEIAQTEAAFGHELSRYWLHNNHMTIDGQKISKSLGNGYTLKDLEKRGFSPIDFKLMVLQSHYRSQSNFTWEGLEAAKARLARWHRFAALRYQVNKNVSTQDPSPEVTAKLQAALEDDLNTPGALKIIDDIISHIESHPLSDIYRQPFENLLRSIDGLLGLDLIDELDISEAQKAIIGSREEARKNKDWNKSDELRDKLAEQGIGLNDRPDGAVWYRL